MKRLLVIVFLAAQVGGIQAAKQYRDFTDTKGRTICGCVLAYNVKSGVVSFERDNRRVSKVPITVFSDADRIYIKEWECRKQFLSNTKFKISAQRKRNKDKDTNSSSFSSRKVELMGYEIVLENCSAVALKGLKVEYCIYYEQDEIKGQQQRLAEGVFCGSFPQGTISPKTKVKKLTETVKIYKVELDPNSYYSSGNIKNVQKGQVRGIWIRVYMKLSSGEKLTRNYCLPDSIDNSKVWMRSSVRAGMN